MSGGCGCGWLDPGCKNCKGADIWNWWRNFTNFTSVVIATICVGYYVAHMWVFYASFQWFLFPKIYTLWHILDNNFSHHNLYSSSVHPLEINIQIELNQFNKVWRPVSSNRHRRTASTSLSIFIYHPLNLLYFPNPSANHLLCPTPLSNPWTISKNKSLCRSK